MPLSPLLPFDCLSRASTFTKVSSSHTRPASTTPSWHPSRAENTFVSQYFPELSAFLLSRAGVLTGWNSKRWSRNSTHSDSGIFLESNSVPVSGLNERPHPRQEYFCTPSGLLPFLAILPHPQNGQASGAAELTNAISSGDGLGCFASYHSRDALPASLSLGTSSDRPKHDQSRSRCLFIVWRFAFC